MCLYVTNNEGKRIHIEKKVEIICVTIPCIDGWVIINSYFMSVV